MFQIKKKFILFFIQCEQGLLIVREKQNGRVGAFTHRNGEVNVYFFDRDSPTSSSTSIIHCLSPGLRPTGVRPQETTTV